MTICQDNCQQWLPEGPWLSDKHAAEGKMPHPVLTVLHSKRSTSVCTSISCKASFACVAPATDWLGVLQNSPASSAATALVMVADACNVAACESALVASLQLSVP